MPEPDVLTRWLARAALRMRVNAWLRETTHALCWIAGAVALHQAARVAGAPGAVLVALLPLLLLVAIAGIALCVWRAARQPTLQQAAVAADSRAGLKDELGSAMWFTEHGPRTPMIELLVERAHATARRLQPAEVFPLGLPRAWPFAAASMAGAIVLASLSAPAVSPATAAAPASGPARLVQRAATPGIAGNATDTESPRERLRASAELDTLVRELASDASPQAIAQAIGVRDAASAAQLMEAVRRRQAAAREAGLRAADRPVDQMSDTLAQGILDRLKEITENESARPQRQQANAEPADRPTDALQRELREEMDNVQSSQPGQSSEDELNTRLRAISRNSTGGRQMVRGDAEQVSADAGRTSVGGTGAMGRRVGVSQAGGGNGEQPRADQQASGDAAPVLGKKTQRLAVQLQAVKVEHENDEDTRGADDKFYAATQAQAAQLGYESVRGRGQAVTEQGAARGAMPLAYRQSVRQYMLEQHRREPKSPAAEP